MGKCAHRGGACAYVRMSTVSFVVNACGLWKRRVGEGYVSSVANSFHLLEGELDGIESLGDESSLGEEAAFLFLGLAVDGNLDGHLGCVLGMMSVTVTDGFSPAPTYLVNVRLGT